jgi:predicted membrane chloride channel (bestrophin family)
MKGERNEKNIMRYCVRESHDLRTASLTNIRKRAYRYREKITAALQLKRFFCFLDLSSIDDLLCQWQDSIRNIIVIVLSMIDYFKGAYGVNLLFRISGSALYKGALAGILALLIYLAIQLRWKAYGGYMSDSLGDPYGVGILVSSVFLLIVFRANYGYQRYWEGVGTIHNFMSKVMDSTMHAAIFHLQNKRYDGVRPPSFFDHDNLNKLNLTRDRRRKNDNAASLVDTEHHAMKSVFDVEKISSHPIIDNTSYLAIPRAPSIIDSIVAPSPLRAEKLRKSIWGSLTESMAPKKEERSDAQNRAMLNIHLFPSTQQPNENFACRPNGQTPPLYLQELAHLSSLLCAVALSTLRNDLEDRESPLDVYSPGSPWPAADPEKLPRNTKLQFQHKNKFVQMLFHCLCIDRNPRKHFKYNVSRPLPVLGGVSDCEVYYLQLARGPYAKAELTFHWYAQFIIREHLTGGMGEVHSAIISRLVQFVSDGMLAYNQARSIMFIPFPFPHAQLCVFFTFIMIPAVPFMMDQYVNSLWSGCILTFLTVTCLVGLHEVARELENPFRNVPNELPMCTMQALYNETLVTMFSGYNPDSFWDPDMYSEALKALAMSKLYQRGCDIDSTKGKVNNDLARRSVHQSENLPQVASTVTDDNARVIMELKLILAQQAVEIEELQRVLDGANV